MTDFERELNWDDEINEESNFILLPDGEYDFTVIDFTRGRHNGSAKLPSCLKAELTLEVSGKEGKAQVKHNLFLHTKTEGLLSQFFISIGQKKHGEPLRMNWNAVKGAKGRCLLEIHEWTKDNGDIGKSNQIKRFLNPVEAPSTPKFEQGKF